MSAISTKGRMHFMVFTEIFTAEVMCRFLGRLVGHFDHKVHLVVDGHFAHRSKKVRDRLAAHPEDVDLHFLPPSSPEPNPDELANADLEHSLPKQQRARGQAEFAAETRRLSADASDNRTPSAATSAVPSSVTPWTRTP